MNEALEQLRGIFTRAMEEWKKEAEQCWNELDPEKRLLITSYVFRKLHEHYMEGGSYRYLIYERLGFGPEAYAVLQTNGALDIHNCISGEGKEYLNEM